MLRRSKRLAGIAAEAAEEQPIKLQKSNSHCTKNTNNLELELIKQELVEVCKLQLQLETTKNDQLKKSEAHHKAETLLWKNRKDSLVFQLNCQKEFYDSETCQLRRALERCVNEFKHLEDRYKELNEDIDEDKLIQKQRKENEFWRKRVRTLKMQLLSKEERKNGEPFEWKICEICLQAYGQREDKTPRFLGCGLHNAFLMTPMIPGRPHIRRYRIQKSNKYYEVSWNSKFMTLEKYTDN